MKFLAIYFSQTGYTRKVAEHIRDGAVEKGADFELRELHQVDPGRLKDYDLVGLGCPVFYYQEPFNVRRFVAELPELKDKLWFVFCSHGSIMGAALDSLAKGLMKKGAVVIGYHDTYADATAPFIPHPTLTTGHPDDEDYAQAKAFGRKIVGRAQRILQGEKGLIPHLPPVAEEWRRSVELFTPRLIEQMVPRLHIDREKCTRCRVCEKNCPVGGIAVDAEPPRIQQPCIYCWRCVMVCPELALDAIDSDWGYLVKSLPQGYAQYRKHLDAAAARGEFRWLIDPDAVNYEDTQLKQRKRQANVKAGKSAREST